MLKILIGLLALGIVVLIHELGHFVAARLCGVTVETFSIGWGPVLFRKKIGQTEYRISALPLGGYCGMKGEKNFGESIEKGLDSIPKEPGSFYGATPWHRILIAFSGPAANLIFAVFLLSLISGTGQTYQTYSNKIIPISTYSDIKGTPADQAGLIAGDRILSFDGKEIKTFTDIQQYISVNAQKNIQVSFSRNDELLNTTVTPELDRKTGAGKIGIYPWIPLIVGSIEPGSAAESAGLRVDDSIIAINGNPVSNYYEFEHFLQDKPEQAVITIQRGALVLTRPIVILYDVNNIFKTGIIWKMITVTVSGTGPLLSVHNGIQETGRIIALTFKSIGLLFRGVDLSEAVSGPVRITVMIGEVAQSSLTGFAELMSIICISLFLMNLLPIPILDGGLILFSVLEIIRRKPIRPKTLYYVQFIGVAFILFLFSIALFGDIRFLTK